MSKALYIIGLQMFLFSCGTEDSGQSRKPVVGPSPTAPIANQPNTNSPASNQVADPGVAPATDPGNCTNDFSADLASLVNTSGNASIPIFGNIPFTLQADAKVAFKNSDATGSVALNALITSFTPAAARPRADAVVGSFKDPMILTYVSGAERLKIFTDPNWKGLECIVLPVKSIRNNSYSYEYNPPIPFLVNPNATAAQLQAVGTRTFPGISARIVKHPTARAGTYQGKALLSVTGSNAKVEFDFGGAAPSANATPLKSIQYVIDSAGKSFSETTMSAFVSDNSLVNLRVTK